MTRLVIGVIGHVDHGKTALVKALTGADTDRLPEEKARGISIALGFAHLVWGDGTVIDLIDMPGHERFVRTMISGATGIDAVLLVVAANEGIKPQTREHIDIAGLLELRRAVVAVSKCDLVTAEEAQQVGNEAVALLRQAGLDPLLPVMTSAMRGEGIGELRQALGGLAVEQIARSTDGLTFLPIDRAFSIAGHGPVVTGTLRGSAVAVGERLHLWPDQRSVRVRSVQVHGERVETALPGQRVALNLRDVEVVDLKRGMALAAPDALAPSDWLTITIRAVEGAPPLKNGKRLRVLFGTDEVDARLRLLDRDVLEPGERGFAQLRLDRLAAIPAREHVILRLISPARTVAGGVILEPVTARKKRNSPPVLARLEGLRDLPPEAIVVAEVAGMGAEGLSLDHLAQLTALPKARIAAMLSPLPLAITREGQVLHKAEQARRRQLTPRPDPAREQKAAELTAMIAEQLRAAGLSPPRPDEIARDALSQHAVDRLLREGVIIRAVDRDKRKEILFHREAIAEAQRVLAPVLRDSAGLLVTEIAAALGISRKYVMPLLDHLDTIRFTRRVGDRRHLHTATPPAR